MSGWQPIKTAPRKHLAPIVLCIVGYEPAMGVWWNPHGQGGRWLAIDPDGVFQDDEQMETYINEGDYRPTHWFALPPLSDA